MYLLIVGMKNHNIKISFLNNSSNILCMGIWWKLKLGFRSRKFDTNESIFDFVNSESETAKVDFFSTLWVFFFPSLGKEFQQISIKSHHFFYFENSFVLKIKT